MDMHRLNVFCKLVELKSFTKAAEAVMLSQPTVSEHVRVMEESIGQKLVDRLGREVLPTPAGHILYKYAREILVLRDEAMQALEQFKGLLSGQLHLGSSTIPGTYILPRAVASFKSQHPAISVTLRISGSGQIAGQIISGDLEAGVIGAKISENHLEHEEIFTDELALVAHPDHPLAHAASVKPKDLLEHAFVARERESGTRMVTEEILRKLGVDPTKIPVVAEIGGTEAVRQSVKAGIGVSILSRLAIEEDLQQGLLKRIDIGSVDLLLRPFYLVRRRNREPSPLCNAFIEALKSTIQNESKWNKRARKQG